MDGLDDVTIRATAGGSNVNQNDPSRKFSTIFDNENCFKLLNADELESEVTEMESLCMNCAENGTTKLLLTKIPHFKEVILLSFYCNHCGFRNNEVQSGGKVQEQGLKLVLKIKNKEDLNRQVVKSEYATISVPEIELEIPSTSHRGEITTVEGILSKAYYGLSNFRSEMLDEKVDSNSEKIDEFLKKFERVCNVEHEFTLILDDPSGNSFIENPTLTKQDTQLSKIHYHRVLSQDKSLGLVADDVEDEDTPDEASKRNSAFSAKDEVLRFPVECPNCNHAAETNMKLVAIPMFKEVMIMATNCEFCGYRTSEVKSGTGIEPKGIKIELWLAKPEDMSRDVLKSETCICRIPELELELGMGTLGGRFTTAEGLLDQIKEQLAEQSGFVLGDSGVEESKDKLDAFLQKLTEAIDGKKQVHLILDDPAGNSYVQSLFTLEEGDERLKVEYYERSWEQKEELGLNDMQTENYTTEEPRD